MDELLRKNKKDSDPFAQREAAKYENPIPSREHILQVLEESSGPMTLSAVCDYLKLGDDTAREAMRRRLNAMERDGQLLSNRKGEFGRIDKMDLIKGRVQGHRDGFGFVIPADGSRDIYLSSRQMRKVFDGDEVLARPGQENFKGNKEGVIVEVLARHTLQLVGRFANEKGSYYVRPDNAKIGRDVLVPIDKIAGATDGQLVMVEIIQQPDRHNKPIGKIVEVLGDHLAPGMEIDVAIRSHDIPHVWPQSVMDKAATLGAQVDEVDKKNRIDLRSLPFVTIDGEDARDFDDAVYCERKRSGGWRLFVAIADVSHYVKPNSALDKEAIERGNSVYFPDFVVPMLPEALSNGLCSLNPLVDRLCMVCEMTISEAGRISGYTFYESIIHSQARLTYTKVGRMLNARLDLSELSENHPDRKVSDVLRNEYAHVVPHVDELHNVYLALLAARRKRGAIEFETTETRILFDDNRKIHEIVPVVRNDAHKLVEECMLAANVCAARFLDKHEVPGLYRVHAPPKPEKVAMLKEFLGELGIGFKGSDDITPSDFQVMLADIQGRPDTHLIQTVMLRSMNQAVYQPVNEGHFGLAYTAYAHFTSPIRRYPDLLVHRAIRHIVRSDRSTKHVKRHPDAKAIAAKNIFPYTASDMMGFGEQCSVTERRADEATRDVVSWLKCEFLQDHVGSQFQGIVSAVVGFGLFVELKNVFVEGLVHITALPSDYYHFQAAQHRLVGERTGKTFRLGDEVSVKVVRVSLDDRKIDFELVSSDLAGHGKKRKDSKRKASKRSSATLNKKNKPKRRVSNSAEQKTVGASAESSRKPRKRTLSKVAAGDLDGSLDAGKKPASRSGVSNEGSVPAVSKKGVKPRKKRSVRKGPATKEPITKGSTTKGSTTKGSSTKELKAKVKSEPNKERIKKAKPALTAKKKVRSKAKVSSTFGAEVKRAAAKSKPVKKASVKGVVAKRKVAQGKAATMKTKAVKAKSSRKAEPIKNVRKPKVDT